MLSFGSISVFLVIVYHIKLFSCEQWKNNNIVTFLWPAETQPSHHFHLVHLFVCIFVLANAVLWTAVNFSLAAAGTVVCATPPLQFLYTLSTVKFKLCYIPSQGQSAALFIWCARVTSRSISMPQTSPLLWVYFLYLLLMPNSVVNIKIQ